MKHFFIDGATGTKKVEIKLFFIEVVKDFLYLRS